ncbi:PREDICTED: uncharacterized protein LOC109217959 [Nicotiana attenuata]|uniref:uncharacterized protein LOC109217959 n=1 Tax=Nicotiana attenuata TaxID=49451 RepID=UPI00090503D3|nr:PREDICTED: uncharacterized protein LOC109217959 [Nicotiana attenuata]
MAGDTVNKDTLDTSSPLYMHPSESAGSMLVRIPFDGTEYRSWKRGVLRSLSVKNKVGFITGKCQKLVIGYVTFDQWERCDDMVTSWILNSLSKDLADNLQYVNDAKELWQELEDRYDQTNGAKLYQLQKKINDLSQGTLDITGYYTKIKKLWEELNALNAHAQCSCQCIYGAKASIQKTEQDKRLVQFLTGLNEVYTVVRGSGNNSHGRGYMGNRPRPFCDFCKRPGHIKDKCYKIHGYPQNMKYNNGNRGRKMAANVFDTAGNGAALTDEGGNSQEQGRTIQQLTNEQYGQLLSILESFKSGNNGDNSGNINMTGGALNFAGMTACNTSVDPSAQSYESFKENADSWILDSGATNYMTYNKASLSNIKTLGLSLRRPLEIGKVRDSLYLYYSNSRKNNSSIIPLTHRSAPSASISGSHSINNVHGQHHLCNSAPSESIPPHVCDNKSVQVPLNSNRTSSNKIDSMCSTCRPGDNHVDLLWHNRLGHVPFIKMKGINSIPIAFASKQPFMSSICPMARHNRSPFPERTTSTTKVFELLHMDMWGPYHAPTHDNHRYFITLVDDYSRCTWTHLLTSKSNALHVIKAFYAMAQNHFNTSIKTISIDNGLEFVNTETTMFFQAKGILQ